MRSTVARRPSTLASFYKYCEEEQLVDRNPPSTSAGRRWTTNPERSVWTSRAIGLYIGERMTGPIFLGAKGGQMDRYAADRTVKRLARRTGIAKRISPNGLRHSFITCALDAGLPFATFRRPPAMLIHHAE